MLLKDLLKQATVTLTNGDYLVANTASVGYLPTRVDTAALAKGHQLFKIVGIGTQDAETGLYPELHVVPVINAEDNKSFVDDTDHPVVVFKDNKVQFVTHRNRMVEKDVYGGTEVHEYDVAAGNENKDVLRAFIAFAECEYSLGVNDFNLEGPEYLEA